MDAKLNNSLPYKGKMSKLCDSWRFDLVSSGCTLPARLIPPIIDAGKVGLKRLLLALIPVIALTGFVLGREGDRGAAALQAGGCDPSYPTVCLEPGVGYTCSSIGFPITVIYDPNYGQTDPYHLDPDFDGVGCE